MAIIETTGRDVYYAIFNCDCGLTGGCLKCQPIYIYEPSPRFDPATFYEAPYPRFVRELQAGIDSHPEWGVKSL